MPRVFVYIAVVYALTCITHAQQLPSKLPVQPAKDLPEKSAPSEAKIHQELFKKSFVKRRKEHLDAVKTLRKMDSYERLYKIIMVLAEKLIEVIDLSKTLIEDSGFDPTNSTFPEDANVRDALSTILENTALFGDIILHLPYITHRILKSQQKWNATIHWSLKFANRTRHLLDKGTLTMIHLVGQELNITKRDPGYFNPYWPTSTIDGKDEDVTKKKKSARKEKRKKGPQMIKIEL